MTPFAVAGHALQLLPSGAVFHLPSSSLLVADAHVGKDTSFRKLGVPVPGLASAGTLERLSLDLGHTQATRLVFLGDFLHAARSVDAALLTMLHLWRNRHPQVAMQLIRGNHDIAAGDPPASLNIGVVNEPHALHATDQRLPLALCHHPQAVAGHYALAGHWHPCTTVHGRGKQRLRLACFWFGDPATNALGVLPAYGEFTGKHPIERRAGDAVFAVAQRQVLALPAMPQ